MRTLHAEACIRPLGCRIHANPSKDARAIQPATSGRHFRVHGPWLYVGASAGRSLKQRTRDSSTAIVRFLAFAAMAWFGWWYLLPEPIPQVRESPFEPPRQAASRSALAEPSAADLRQGVLNPEGAAMGVLGPRVAQCKIRVLARETGAAQSGVRTTVWTDKGRTQLGDAAGAHTDTHGRSSVEVPADRELIVIAHGDQALIGGGHADVSPLQAGETRTVVVHVSTQPDLRVSGVVLASDTREPVVGARVRARPRATGGEASKTRTSTDGGFE